MDTQIFRETLAHFATGVTVVISRTAELTHGMTVNSFTSVSLDPPLILFCADNRSDTLQVVQKSWRFTVSVLSDQQEDLSRRFAMVGPQDDIFRQTACQSGIDGIPYLADGLAFFDCGVHDMVPAGDHHIIIGHVDRLGLLRPGRPLMFFQSHYYRPVTLPPG